MESHQQRMETKDLALMIKKKGNWKSVMGRKHLGIFNFLNNIPEDDSLFSVEMLRWGRGGEQKNPKL